MYRHDAADHKRVSKPELLRFALDRQIRKLGVSRRMEGGRAMSAWSETVGPEIASRSTAEMFERGTLTVAVDDAAWRQELLLEKTLLVERLNAALGKKVVRDIFFVAGSRRKRR